MGSGAWFMELDGIMDGKGLSFCFMGISLYVALARSSRGLG